MNQLPVKVTYLFILQLGKNQLQFKVTTTSKLEIEVYNQHQSMNHCIIDKPHNITKITLRYIINIKV